MTVQKIFLTNLVQSGKEAVNIISGGVGIHSLLMFFDLLHDELSQYFYLGKGGLVAAWQVFHQPGKDVVQLLARTRGSQEELVFPYTERSV